MGRGGTLIEGLVGIAIDSVASKADLAFLERVQTDARRIEGCLGDLQELPPLPGIADKVNLTERFMTLETILMVDRHGLGLLERLSRQGKDTNPVAEDVGELILRDIDWDPALQPHSDLMWRELQAVLQEELDRLPEKYRAPFVLCCLEGKTQAQAASLLGWKQGTVSGRLAKARKELQRRLARRGVTLSAVLGALALSDLASGAVPGLLIQGTIKAALVYAAGRTGGAISAEAAALAKAVLQGMGTTKLKTAAAFMLVVAIGVSAAGFLAYYTLAAPAPEARQQGQTSSPPQIAARPQARTDLYGDPLPAGAIARLGTVRFRHGGSGIDAVAFCTDGKTLVSASGNTTVLWELSSGRELRHFRCDHVVGCLAISADGLKLAATDYVGGAIHLWDVATGHELRVLRGHTDHICGVAFSADGRLLASGSGQNDRTIRVWDATTGKELRRFQGDLYGYRSIMAFSRDARFLATAGGDRATHIWDLQKGKEQLTVPDGLFVGAFSPDGKMVATTAGDGRVRLWDLPAGKELRQLPSHQYTHNVAFAPDGKTVVSASVAEGIRLWNVATGQELRRLAGSQGTQALAFSQDGKTLASGDGGTVHLWKVATGHELKPFGGHSNHVLSIAWCRDGKTIISASETIRLWEPFTGKERTQITTRLRHVEAVALAPNGGTFAAAGNDGIILYDRTTGQELRQFPKESNFTLNITFAPSGKILASEGNEAIHIWDVATGKELRQFGTAAHQLGSSGFSANGEILALAGRDEVGLWQVATGKKLHQLAAANPCAVAFSPDGKLLACGSQHGMIHIWDALTRKPLCEFRSHRYGGCSIAFSPDSRTLAVGAWHSSQAMGSGQSTAQGVVRLWEVATGVPPERHAARAATLGGPAAQS